MQGEDDDGRIEGARIPKLLQGRPDEKGAVGRLRIDAVHLIARPGEPARQPSFAAAHIKDSRRRMADVALYEGGDTLFPGVEQSLSFHGCLSLRRP